MARTLPATSHDTMAGTLDTFTTRLDDSIVALGVPAFGTWRWQWTWSTAGATRTW